MKSTASDKPKEKAAEAPRELIESDEVCSFGPTFFLRQLRAFIRDRCPDPADALPSVQLHLAEGDVLDVCHVIGIAPRWLALAAVETDRPASAPTMRTEIIPYALISRITVRSCRPEPGHVGFEANHGPAILSGHESPEATFLAMAGINLADLEAARTAPGTKPRGTVRS